MSEEISIDSAGRIIFHNAETKPQEYGEGYTLLTKEDEDSASLREQLGNEMATLVQEVAQQKPDTLVWLDKSARPAQWFFDYLWNENHPNTPAPESKFVNIGQEKGPSEDQELYFHTNKELFKASVRSNETQVNKLRQHFRIKADQEPENPTHTYLDNKNILILDEFSSTGATLLTAQALFEAAFGNRYYDNIQARSIFSVEPPWISISYESDPEALGVQDRKPGDFSVKRITPVPKAVFQLKKELKMLAKETAARLDTKD